MHLQTSRVVIGVGHGHVRALDQLRRSSIVVVVYAGAAVATVLVAAIAAHESAIARTSKAESRLTRLATASGKQARVHVVKVRRARCQRHSHVIVREPSRHTHRVRDVAIVHIVVSAHDRQQLRMLPVARPEHEARR